MWHGSFFFSHGLLTTAFSRIFIFKSLYDIFKAFTQTDNTDICKQGTFHLRGLTKHLSVQLSAVCVGMWVWVSVRFRKDNHSLPVSKENNVVWNDLWESEHISQHDIFPDWKKRGHYFTVTSNVSSCDILAFHLRHGYPRLCILVCRLQRDVCLVTLYDLKCAIADCNTSHSSSPSLLGLFWEESQHKQNKEPPHHTP